MNGGRRTLWQVTFLTAALAAIGTVGLSQLEGISRSEAFYQTIILMLTHYDHYGFSDSRSRILVVFLVVTSLVIVAYLLKWFAEYMMGIGGNVRKRRVKIKVSKLKDHYIVCGLGRVGSQVVLELSREGVNFVGLDREQSAVDDALSQGYLAEFADSTLEENLIAAGIERAKGIVACLGDDSHNLFVTLAARSLNPEIYIVARANRQENDVKLKRAGADRVALPYHIGGYHMASMAIRPNVVDYIDIVSNSNTRDLEVEEMVVGEDSTLSGHKLGKSLTVGKFGATVIAINGADGSHTVRPSGDEVIYPGDRLIVLGAKKDLTEASALIR